MDFDLLAIVVAVLGAYLAWKANQSTASKIVSDLRATYATPEVYLAVRRLWKFYNNNKDKDHEKLKQAFKNIYNDEEKYKVKFNETLDYQRRVVKMFYEDLANYYLANVITDNIFDRFWDIETLRIIKDILLPMEEAKAELVNSKFKPKRFSPLKLYYEIEKRGETKMSPKSAICITRWTGVIMSIISVVYGFVYFTSHHLFFRFNLLLYWPIFMFIGLGLIIVVKLNEHQKE